MTIYILTIFAILVLGLFTSVVFQSNKSKKIYATIAFLLVFIISAFRDISVGSDVLGYVNYFFTVKNMGVSDLFLHRFEPGYIVLNKLLCLFIDNEQLFLAAIALIVLTMIFIGIYKYSSIPSLSVYLFITMGFFAFTLSGFRQAIAMGIVFLSFTFLKENKLLKFVLIILLASLFHKTALMFLLIYPLAHKKINLKYLTGAAILFMVLFFVRKPLLHFLTYAFFDEYSSMLVSSQSFTLLFVIFIVFISGLVFFKPVLKRNPQNIILYNIILFAIFMQLFATESNNFSRITNYFYIYAILFIPEVLASIKDKNILPIGCIIVVCLTFVQFVWLTPGSQLSIVPYQFFWQ
jgi:hypothetical protein